MLDWIKTLFDTSDFPERWNCGNWSESLGWTYITADLLIFGAYFAIPTAIFIFAVRRRGDLNFPTLYWLFAAFIFSCGIGHFVDATLFWKPWYRFSALVNGVTALVSWATVVALVRYLPEAARLPGALRLSRQLEEQIEAQKKVEEGLRESELRFRTLAENVPLIIFTTTPSGSVDYFNSAFSRHTGMKPEDSLGDRWFIAVHPDDLAELRANWEKAVESKAPFVSECRLRMARGEYRWYSIHTVPLPGDNGRKIGYGADITDQKEDTEKRIKTERQIQETQKLESLGVLAGGIAHDFNNLLTGILGSSALAQMDLPEQHPAREYLTQIETSSMRAADLCRQMLAYSGKGRFVITRIDMSRLIEETTYLIQSSISKKAVIRFNLEPNLPACEGDATQLRQVVMNLVINASDAIGDRSGYININTGTLRADSGYLTRTFGAGDLPAGDYVFVEVGDSGCGMAPETISRIFDPFFTTKFSGRGLGLAAVLGIVKGHKGAIRVYSELGKGTTFKMLLPASKEKAEDRDFLVESERSAIWKSQGTVLVVDDEETIRAVTCRILELWGFRCLAAADGREGVDLFIRHQSEIRVVVMDLTMPHLDGEQAFREMRQVSPDVAVVLMSGFNEQEAINRFVGRGLAGFVQKPFNPRQLEAVLRRALGEEAAPG